MLKSEPVVRIAPDEPTETELLLEDLAEEEADFELEQLATREKERLQKEKEKEDGEDVRNASMESLGETTSRRKRSKNNDSSDVLEYLSSKRDKELELKERARFKITRARHQGGGIGASKRDNAKFFKDANHSD